MILRSAFAIFKRDFKKFLSTPAMIIMTLFLPIMYLVIFGNAMGGTITHIPVGVVQETPPYNDTQLFTSATYRLNHISQTDAEKLLDVTVYADEIAAKQDLANGKLAAVIVFPSEVTNDNTIRLYVDSADSITPPLVEAGLNQVLLSIGAHNTVLVDKIYGNIKYIQFFGVSVIMMAIFSATMMGGGMALIRDRENGIHEGYLVTPVKRSSIILGIITSGTVRAFIAGVCDLLDRFAGHRDRRPEPPGIHPRPCRDPDLLYRGDELCRLPCLALYHAAGIHVADRFF